MRHRDLRMLGAVLAVLASLQLTACGFQLQGSDNWPDAWRAYALEFPRRDGAMQDFVDELHDALRQRGLREADGGPHFNLKMTALRDQKSIAAIGADGKAVEFDLARELTFFVQARDWRSAPISLSASRRLSFDPAVVLAKEAEEQRLLAALSRELSQRLLLRVEAELRRRDP